MVIMYGSEYHDYHFFLALNIFNVVCSTEIRCGLNALLSIISFEHGQLNGLGLQVNISLILLKPSIELFCSGKVYKCLHSVISDRQMFSIFFLNIGCTFYFRGENAKNTTSNLAGHELPIKNHEDKITLIWSSPS